MRKARWASGLRAQNVQKALFPKFLESNILQEVSFPVRPLVLDFFLKIVHQVCFRVVPEPVLNSDRIAFFVSNFSTFCEGPKQILCPRPAGGHQLMKNPQMTTGWGGCSAVRVAAVSGL